MSFPDLVRWTRRRRSAQQSGAISSRTPSRRDERGDIDPQPDRHPAMARIDVSPVHGRHCDCERCRKDGQGADPGRSDRRRPAA
ncbi:MAG TPA: hypothetical protein VG186_06555 [Solirubrobacteraceae bacterium]|nr:hypothetical protein [Solirubrobacteraceae bacterium]